MRIFLAGVIQGSHAGNDIHPQDYRSRLKEVLLEMWPDAKISDPFEGNENSVYYDDEKGKTVFFKSIQTIRECNLMLAYLPEASMGTAIEMWECRKCGVPVWSITPMKTNWVVRFFSDRIFDSIEALSRYLQYERSISQKES